MARIDPDTRAAALADLLAGEQPAVVAARYGVSPSLVRTWKQRHATPSDSGESPDESPRPPIHESPSAPTSPIQRPTLEAQHQRIGALILDLLAEKIEAARAIARAARDPDWIKQYSPADVAVLAQQLDTSLLAIGDRLAGSGPPPTDE